MSVAEARNIPSWSQLGRTAALIAVTILAQPARAQDCLDWRAEIINVEGAVEKKLAGSPEWIPVARGDSICRGESIRVLESSRAALRLPDDNEIRLDEFSTLRSEEIEDEGGSLLNLLQGIIHVLSRDSRLLRFTTPFANAGLEGTEFILEVTAARAVISVIEGRVTLEQGERVVLVGPGERAIAEPASPPALGPARRLEDTIAWTLHYPPLWADPVTEASGADRAETESLARRASEALATGRVTAAEADLARALALDPSSADALAVSAVIAVANNDASGALRLAERALESSPSSLPGLLAQAIAQEGAGDFESMRRTLRAATAVEPDNAYASTLLAQVELGLGNFAAALTAAQQAAAAQPDLADPHTTMGFAHLIEQDLVQAIRAFERAISLDQAAPLPHAGLGLSLIQSGELEEGRRALDVAVLLDPNDARLRSYAAKAYFEDDREQIAGGQLELAKLLDATDPTAWLYDSLRKTAANRPVAAVRDALQAAALSNRAGRYRSRLYLDEDLAVRSAAHAQPFRDVGFDQLALNTAWKAVQLAPEDYAGHRMLADSYGSLPRHQIARINELTVSQLLQPFNVTPIPAQLAEPNLFIEDLLGLDALAFGEFNPLLLRNHVTVQGSGHVGGNDTRSEQATVSGIQDRLSFSLGAMNFETAGYRENNDFDMQVRNAFFQYRIDGATSVLAELRSSATEKGDLRLLFDRTDYSRVLRQDDEIDSIRLGAQRIRNDRSRLLSVFHYQDGLSRFSVGPALAVTGEFETFSYELQSMQRMDRWHVTSGISLSRKDLDQAARATLSLPVPPFQLEQTSFEAIRTESVIAYAYGDFAINRRLVATIGGSLDILEGILVDERQFNPKLGLRWEPGRDTSVRIAAVRALQGPLVSKENILPRLEPTQVAGFNQFFFGSEGDESTRVGLAVDHDVSADLHFGLEVSERDVERSIIVIGQQGTASTSQVKFDESLLRAYAYWSPRESLALSAEPMTESVDNRGQVLSDGFAKLRTSRLPVRLRYSHPSGWRAGVEVTWVDQTGRFGELIPEPGGLVTVVRPDGDQFRVIDASVSYKLPARHGTIGLYIHNLADEKFRFQDTDPENPRIIPERLVALRFTLAL